MDENWSYNSAKTVGRSHLREKPPIPCQDSVLTIENNDVIVTALSDGCGSSMVSEVGSNITTKVLCNYLSTYFDELYALPEIEIKKKIVAHIINEEKKYLSENPNFVSDYLKKDPNHRNKFIKNWLGFKNANKIYPLTLLDATVQFVAIKGNRAMIGRLGDGVIGLMQNGYLKIQSMEDKIGVESNATWYPSTIMIVLENTQVNPWNNFEIQKFGDISDCSLFLIMSDGVGDVLVGEDNTENTKFLYPDELDKALKTSNLFDLLENDYKHKPGIYDDLSISIIKKRECEIKGIVLREYDSDGKTIANTRIEKIALEDLTEESENTKIPAESTTDKEKEDNQSEETWATSLLDIKYVMRLQKLLQGDKKKYGEIISATNAMLTFMQDKKSVTFDDILKILNPNTVMYDVILYATYWAKIKLFKVNTKKKTIYKR